MRYARRHTVLLLDFDAARAVRTARQLQAHGMAVETPDSAQDVLGRLDESPRIDVVLAEIEPGAGTDGPELAGRILERRELPIVFLAESAEKEWVERVAGVPHSGYVIRSSGEHLLHDALATALRLAAPRRERDLLNQFTAFMKGFPGATFIKDAEGRVLFCNEFYASLLGTTPDHIVGSVGTDPLPPELEEQYRRENDQVIAQKKVLTSESSFTDHGEESHWLTYKFPIVMGDMTLLGAVSLDMTEQKRIEAELRRSEREKNVILDSTVEMVAFYDLDFTVRWANRAAAESVGASAHELIGRHCYEIWQGRTSPCPDCPVELARSTGRGQEAVQETPDGRYWSLRGYPVLDEEGEVTGLVEFGRDITEQKHRESDLHRAIREKNLLMKELNHRVKNNLAMVASLVSIKEANLDGVTDLSDLRAQVRAISFIHEKLYESDRVASISLRGYLETLLGSVFSFYSGRPVRLENRVTDVSFSVKTTAHLGLIINELATNAMKYGFPGEEEPRFSVALARRPSSDGKREGYSLTVSNSGVPFPAHIDLAEPTTLGLQLISALVDELGGMIEVEREPYPEFSIWFPEE